MAVQRETAPSSSPQTPASAEAKPAAPGAPVKAELRGMSYDEGAARLAPPPDGGKSGAPSAAAPGSAMTLASSGERELSWSESFMPELASRLAAKEASIDAVLQDMSQRVISVSNGAVTHPTIASVGDLKGPTFGSAPNRRGVFVANSFYAEANPLPSRNEIAPVMAQFEARGFANSLQENLDAAPLADTFRAPIKALAPGDELVLNYVGHGRPEGLVGVSNRWDAPDIMAHSRVAGVMAQAAARGAHVRFIAMACMSGAAAETLRGWEWDRVEDSPLANRHWLGQVDALQAMRRELEKAEGLTADSYQALEDGRREAFRRSLKGTPEEQQLAKAEAQKYDSAKEALVKSGGDALNQAWAAMQGKLAAIAGEIAGADGKALVAVPAALDLRLLPSRTRLGFLLGTNLDCLDDLTNRALALASAGGQGLKGSP